MMMIIILPQMTQISHITTNNKIKPFISAEIYGLLNNPFSFFTKTKYVLGLRYPIGKYGRIKSFYRIDRELNNNNPYTYYNLGIEYRYDF